MTPLRFDSRIAVLGAGPAGLAMASALKIQGFESVQVFEKVAAFAPIGGGIGLQSNGFRVLERLGVLDAITEKVHFRQIVTIEDIHEHVIARMDFGELNIPQNHFGVMLRTDLLDILYARTRQLGIPIHFGRPYIRVEQTGGIARVLLEADEPVDADCIIACDGVHSPLRDQLQLPYRHRKTGTSYMRGVVDMPVAPDMFREFWGPGGQRFGLGYLPPNRTYFFCSTPYAGLGQYSNEALSEWFASWNKFPPIVQEILQAAPDVRRAYNDQLQEVRLSKWFHGPIIFIGDAAHAMTPNMGQGANSAFVDAWVLSCLMAQGCKDKKGLEEIGQRFQRIRQPFVQTIQDRAWMVEQLGYYDQGVKRLFRDALFLASRSIGPLRRASLKVTAGYNPKEQPFFAEAP